MSAQNKRTPLIRRIGVTFVELLVVIAIIDVFVAFLLGPRRPPQALLT
jgi:Tfp pilus assembly protein FimT